MVAAHVWAQHIVCGEKHAIWLNQLAPAGLQNALVRYLYQRDEGDTFQAHYRANTPARLDGLLSDCGLCHIDMRLVGDPTHIAFDRALFALGRWIERVLPEGWQTRLMGDYTWRPNDV